MPMDGQNLLPSWNDGATRRKILDFISRVTDEHGTEYVPPEERIAVFDNDGTLWCEKPMYIQLAFILQHMAEDAANRPELRERQPWKAAYEGHLEWLGEAITKHYRGDDSDLQMLAAGIVQTYAGMTVDQFEELADDFLRSELHPTLQRPYVSCIYRPMRELLNCLVQHGFTNYIASGGGRDFMRPVTEELYGIPRERVIGSSVSLSFVPDDAGGSIVHLAEIDVFADGLQKPVSIWNQIGRRPILAAGNSNGDIPMLEFIEDRSRSSLGLLLHHDDAEREFAYDAGAEVALETAEPRHWTMVSMREDWGTVF